MTIAATESERERTFNLFEFDTKLLYNLNLNTETVDENCRSKEARFFVTYTCEQDSETLADKKNQAAKISCLAVALILVYLSILHYFKRHSDLTQKKWDMLTVTPGDYTMQLEITEEMW